MYLNSISQIIGMNNGFGSQWSASLLIPIQAFMCRRQSKTTFGNWVRIVVIGGIHAISRFHRRITPLKQVVRNARLTWVSVVVTYKVGILHDIWEGRVIDATATPSGMPDTLLCCNTWYGVPDWPGMRAASVGCSSLYTGVSRLPVLLSAELL